MSRNFELLQRAERERGGRASAAEREIPGPVLRGGPIETVPPARLPGAATSGAEAEIARLVHNVFLEPRVNMPRAVVFARIDAGEEPDWVCARAAEELAAEVEGSVCVVDANLASPSLHRFFEIENNRGLRDGLLEGGALERFGQFSESSQVTIIPAGGDSAEAESLLLADEGLFLVERLAAHFDYVLIDAPPLTVAPLGALLARRTDGLVMVLEAHATRRDIARKIKQELDAAGINILGAVLNNRTFPIPDSLYSRL